ncbi:MAG TPA: hypothetical protein DCZ03_09885 [Gammaproteobacteria bacterium]|nr:hypothetical protein [Gammaproteobacteria bacterium]
MTHANHNKSKKLTSLAAAAMALPGMLPPVAADTMPTETSISYRHTQYQEDDVSADLTASGEHSARYDINVDQFHILKPFARDYTFSLNLVKESMTGASPYSNSLGVDGDPKLNMSGASIDESRTDLSGKVTKYSGQDTTSVSLGISTEHDYQAIFLGAEFSKLMNEQQSTLSAGVEFSTDTIEPTQQQGFTRIDEESKSGLNSYVGWSQILNQKTQWQTSISLGYLDGYLSDPYKTFDVRPDSRLQLAWNHRLRRFFERFKASGHLDYRLYTDDWGIVSHTFKMAWYQQIDAQVTVVPNVRYYSQSQADFYYSIDNSLRTGEQSSDYRLSPYGAITTGVQLIARFGQWRTILSVDRYDSSADYALGEVSTESPGLVDFLYFTFGFDYSF